MNYQWANNKATANLKKHKIDFADAATVFNDDLAITIEDNHPSEDRFVSIGMDALGRILIVVYTWRGDDIRLISARTATKGERTMNKDKTMNDEMKQNYDFSEGTRGAIDPMSSGKTRITIRLDNDVLEWFRQQVHLAEGGNYQILINQALREYILAERPPRQDKLMDIRQTGSSAPTASPGSPADSGMAT